MEFPSAFEAAKEFGAKVAVKFVLGNIEAWIVAFYEKLLARASRGVRAEHAQRVSENLIAELHKRPGSLLRLGFAISIWIHRRELADLGSVRRRWWPLRSNSRVWPALCFLVILAAPRLLMDASGTLVLPVPWPNIFRWLGVSSAAILLWLIWHGTRRIIVPHSRPPGSRTYWRMFEWTLERHTERNFYHHGGPLRVKGWSTR